MKFQVKLVAAAASIALFSNLLMLVLTIPKIQEALFKQVQSKALSIASTASALLDGSEFEKVKTREDEKSATYRELQARLRILRNANRRDDVHVEYIYTLQPAPNDPSVLLLGIDPEELLENQSHVGDVYKGVFGTRFSMLDRPLVDESPSRDQWGEWISAYAPVKNRLGKTVSMLGIDLRSGDVKKITTSDILKIAAVSFAISSILAVALSLLLFRTMSRPLRQLQQALQAIGTGNYGATITINSSDEFGEIATAFNKMSEGLKQRENLKAAFARYVSSHIMEKVLSQDSQAVLEGERRKVTVLFADIRNFTKLSENLPPEDVVRILNEYLERMVGVIYKYDGTLDKFLGDGIMAIFGAPVGDKYQEEHAIRAAIDMQKELGSLCEKWMTQGRPAIQVGIGINTGLAIVGNIGSNQHMEYTAIGDTVNLASRMESMTKELNCEILVTDYSYIAVKNTFQFRRIGELPVRGRELPVAVYTIDTH